MKSLVLVIAAIAVIVQGNSLGNQESRIVNGYNATNTQFPWFVSIRGTVNNGGTTLCGGALISSQYVLTAAHCVVGLVSAQLGFGSNLLSNPLLQTNSNSFTINPSYNPQTFANDLALIRLPVNLTTNAYIATIRLPARSQQSATFLNVVGSVVGYGRVGDTGTNSVNLRYAPVTVISNTQCAQTYGSAIVINSTVCTLGREYNMQGPCAFDNGGPLSIVESNINTLIGVVSFISSQGCTAGHPTGYVRTANYLTWINQVTGIPIRA